MKAHRSLEQLLEDYTSVYLDRILMLKTGDMSDFIKNYCASNTLGLGKEKPLLKLDDKCDCDHIDASIDNEGWTICDECGKELHK